MSSKFSFEAAIFNDENNVRTVRVPVGFTSKGTKRYAQFSVEGYADRTPDAVDKMIRGQESENIRLSTTVEDKDGVAYRDVNTRHKDFVADSLMNYRKSLRPEEPKADEPTEPKKNRKNRKNRKDKVTPEMQTVELPADVPVETATVS